jgi:hypothetical protein
MIAAGEKAALREGRFPCPHRRSQASAVPNWHRDEAGTSPFRPCSLQFTSAGHEGAGAVRRSNAAWEIVDIEEQTE